jgi:hypothetical protein
MVIVPCSSMATQSVKVPPMSTPTIYFIWLLTLLTLRKNRTKNRLSNFYRWLQGESSESKAMGLCLGT